MIRTNELHNPTHLVMWLRRLGRLHQNDCRNSGVISVIYFLGEGGFSHLNVVKLHKLLNTKMPLCIVWKTEDLFVSDVTWMTFDKNMKSRSTGCGEQKIWKWRPLPTPEHTHSKLECFVGVVQICWRQSTWSSGHTAQIGNWHTVPTCSNYNDTITFLW